MNINLVDVRFCEEKAATKHDERQSFALSNSLLFLGFTSVLMTFMKFDWRGLHVNSQICRTKLFIHDGHRLRRFAASLMFVLNISSWKIIDLKTDRAMVRRCLPVHYHSKLAHPGLLHSFEAVNVSTIASKHRFLSGSEPSGVHRRHNFWIYLRDSRRHATRNVHLCSVTLDMMSENVTREVDYSIDYWLCLCCQLAKVGWPVTRDHGRICFGCQKVERRIWHNS